VLLSVLNLWLGCGCPNISSSNHIQDWGTSEGPNVSSGPNRQVWEADGDPDISTASISGSWTSAWSSIAQTSRTSCGGSVNRALREALLRPELASYSWVPSRRKTLAYRHPLIHRPFRSMVADS